jgi:hypothetical protein
LSAKRQKNRRRQGGHLRRYLEILLDDEIEESVACCWATASRDSAARQAMSALAEEFAVMDGENCGNARRHRGPGPRLVDAILGRESPACGARRTERAGRDD